MTTAGLAVLLTWALLAEPAEPSSGEAPDAGAADASPSDGESVDLATDLPRQVAPETKKVRLRGRVVAKGTRDRLAGATVIVDAVPVGETNESGRFEVDVPPGARRIQIQQPGHEPVDKVVDARA